MKRIGINISLFIIALYSLCCCLAFLVDNVSAIKAQHKVIVENDIDVRALFYMESETGQNAVVDIRKNK